MSDSSSSQESGEGEDQDPLSIASADEESESRLDKLREERAKLIGIIFEDMQRLGDLTIEIVEERLATGEPSDALRLGEDAEELAEFCFLPKAEGILLAAQVSEQEERLLETLLHEQEEDRIYESMHNFGGAA